MRIRVKKLAAVLALGWAVCFSSTARAADFRVNDADVRQVMMAAARLGGFNVVVDEAVSGTITLHLQNVEPLDVIKFVAAARNFTVQETGGVYLVTVNDPTLAARKVHTFSLSYANPTEAAEMIRRIFGQNGGKNSQAPPGNVKDGVATKNFPQAAVVADPATGTLILSGTEAEAAAVREILREIDAPSKQISLEAKVVAIEKNAAKKLGVEWQWSALPQYPESSTEYEQQTYTSVDNNGNMVTIRESTPNTKVTRAWKGLNSVPGIWQFGRGPEGQPFEFYYEATINALISDGKAKLLSRPNITTLQGKEATINIGGEVPVPTVSTANTTTTTSLTYREAGIILRYTPRLDADNHITARVHTEVSSPIYVEELKAYRFQKRAADTTVRLKNGETMVIGGLIGSEESRSLSKVPFLGDLPILGAFFRHVKESKQDSEIMIFLTARVVE